MKLKIFKIAFFACVLGFAASAAGVEPIRPPQASQIQQRLDQVQTTTQPASPPVGSGQVQNAAAQTEQAAKQSESRIFSVRPGQAQNAAAQTQAVLNAKQQFEQCVSNGKRADPSFQAAETKIGVVKWSCANFANQQGACEHAYQKILNAPPSFSSVSHRPFNSCLGTGEVDGDNELKANSNCRGFCKCYAVCYEAASPTSNGSILPMKLPPEGMMACPSVKASQQRLVELEQALRQSCRRNTPNCTDALCPLSVK